MTLEQLISQILKQYPNEPVYLLNPDGEIEEQMSMKELLGRVVIGERQAKRYIKRYCRSCQASVIGNEQCPLCQQPTEAMTEELVPVKHVL